MQKFSIILLLLLILTSCKYFERDIEPELEPQYEIKIKVLNEFGTAIPSNYSLSVYNNLSTTFNPIKNGVTDSIYTIIYDRASEGKVYKLEYWTGKYYKKSIIIKNLYKHYLNELHFKAEDRKGIVQIKFLGSLKPDEYNKITLRISAKNGTLKPSLLCIDHSFKILSVIAEDDFTLCNTWVNYSIYPHNNSLCPLPIGQYRCTSEDYILSCKDVTFNQCYYNTITIPSNVPKTVSNCFKIGETITDDYRFPLIVRTMPFLTIGDYLDVYIVDTERSPMKYTLKY